MLSETPGKLLSAARESKSLTHADIAKQTRLSLQAINDIEHDVYDRFGAATFVRGYLRSYARAVGVSEEAILVAWDASDAMAKLTSPAPSVIGTVSIAENTDHQDTSNAPSRAVMVIGALVVLSAIAWWEDQSQNAKPVVVNTPVVAAPLKAPAVLPVPAVAPAQVAAKAETPTVQPEEVTTHQKVAAKKVKRAVARRHRDDEPMHVTYTLKPVSPNEMASDN